MIKLGSKPKVLNLGFQIFVVQGLGNIIIVHIQIVNCILTYLVWAEWGLVSICCF